jgi:single stranded DNA-binding protein
MLDTQVTIVGKLVADQRLYYTSDGQPMASFRLASTPRRFHRGSGEWRDGETLWVNVTCWRGLAENVATSLKKGQAAIVMGRLSARLYETKDGDKRQSVDVEAAAVGPELSRVVTVVRRAERGAPPALAVVEVPAGEPADPAGPTAPAEAPDLAAEEAERAWASVAAPEPGDADPDFPDAGDPDEPDERRETADALSAADAGDPSDSSDETPELVGTGGRRKARFGLG